MNIYKFRLKFKIIRLSLTWSKAFAFTEFGYYGPCVIVFSQSWQFGKFISGFGVEFQKNELHFLGFQGNFLKSSYLITNSAIS
jgi:hypothetical protein